MREIKFRAWDDKGKYFKNIDDDGDFYFRDDTNGLELWDKFGKCKNVILLQFTGLKDKNGKEIYEGDILRDPVKSDWDKVNYSCFEVFFHDGDAHFDYNIGFTMARMHNHGSVCGGRVPSFKPNTTKAMIVIGNIYENPELINP